MDKKSFLFRLMIIIFIFICGFSFYHHLNNEMWNDEIYTLNHFVLVPLQTTLYDYHVPNNHIFFSLLAKAYLWLIGFTDLVKILLNPFMVRLPMLALSLTLLYYFWKSSEYFFSDKKWRIISLILFCSNVVFGNFVFQYRGYGVSMLFLLLIFYHLLKINSNKRITFLSFVVIVFSSFAAFYTTPSNLYFIIVLGIFPFAYYLKKRENFTSLVNSLEFRSGLIIGGGILFGFAAYSLIFKEVFANEYVSNSSPFAFTNFERTFKSLIALSSFHFILFFYGIFLLLKNIYKKEYSISFHIWFLIFVCCLPSFFSFLHGDVPPDRTYSVILPFFTLLLTKSLYSFTNRFLPVIMESKLILIPIYLFLHFCVSEFYIYEKLAKDNSNGDRDQNLILQYHNYHFNSMDMIGKLNSREFNTIPICFTENFDNTNVITDAFGIKTEIYEKKKIPYRKYILITNKPFSDDNIKSVSYDLLNESTCYFKLYFISRND